MSIYENKAKCRYSYCRKGRFWAVYDNNNGSKVCDDFLEEEDARKKVYELNSWQYKSKN